MTNRLWVFPALFCVLIATTFLGSFQPLALILCLIWLIRIARLKQRRFFCLTLGIGAAFLVVLSMHLATNHTKLEGDEKELIFYPELTSIQIDGDQLRMEGRVYFETIEEKMHVSYYFESKEEKEWWENASLAKHFQLTGELVTPTEHSNFYQFNYRKYLQQNQIHWQFRADNIDVLEATHAKGCKRPPFFFIENIRQAIFSFIEDVFNPKIGSYIKTLFFADKRQFSSEALQYYRALGVVHLFSISGFHISYFAQLLRKWLLKIGMTHEYTNRVLLVFLPLYGLLAGFGVSVFRAVFQNVFLTLGKIRNKPIDTIDAWALTMLFALFLNPYLIYHIAFQLSYLLSGLFILMGKQKWISELHPVVSALLYSFLSFFASLPVLTVHFFEVSWITIGANLLFIPFFTFVVFPSLLFLMFYSLLFGASSSFLFLQELLTIGIETMEGTLRLLNETFDFSFVTGRLPAVVLILLIGAIFKVLSSIENKKSVSVLALLSIGLSLLYHQLVPIGYVMMLDVGQGEAIVLKDPETKKITLIDTGGRVQWGEKEDWQAREKPFSIGADTVVPALKAFGIQEIDRLYITHADVDHFGEIQNIGKLIPINEVVASHATLTHELALEQLNSLPHTERKVLHQSQTVHLPTKQSVAILPMGESESKNNQSLVLYVNIGKDTWLFTGDIEQEAEQKLIQQYPQLQANYLKVAHHGSQTSSTKEFIHHVSPKEAWISAGANNSFGHPNPEVIERFTDNNIQIFQTNKNGAIIKRYFKIPVINLWKTETKSVHIN